MGTVVRVCNEDNTCRVEYHPWVLWAGAILFVVLAAVVGVAMARRHHLSCMPSQGECVIASDGIGGVFPGRVHVPLQDIRDAKLVECTSKTWRVEFLMKGWNQGTSTPAVPVTGSCSSSQEAWQQLQLSLQNFLVKFGHPKATPRLQAADSGSSWVEPTLAELNQEYHLLEQEDRPLIGGIALILLLCGIAMLLFLENEVWIFDKAHNKLTATFWSVSKGGSSKKEIPLDDIRDVFVEVLPSNKHQIAILHQDGKWAICCLAFPKKVDADEACRKVRVFLGMEDQGQDLPSAAKNKQD